MHGSKGSAVRVRINMDGAGELTQLYIHVIVALKLKAFASTVRKKDMDFTREKVVVRC